MPVTFPYNIRFLLDFVVVHNGIITNYKDIKRLLEMKGYKFESETDTEVIAKMIQHVYDRHPRADFRQLVELAVLQLVSYLLIIAG